MTLSKIHAARDTFAFSNEIYKKLLNKLNLDYSGTYDGGTTQGIQLKASFQKILLDRAPSSFGSIDRVGSDWSGQI